MAEITPTTSLYLLSKYQRVGEPDADFKIHNIREYPSQYGRGTMKEIKINTSEEKYIYFDMCPKLLL